MKALDAYRDVLKELDKFESPSFDIRDFNYFFPKAISRYIDQNYRQFDVLQKEVDDIGSMLKLNQPLQLASDGTVALPADYRHMLGVRVKVKFIATRGKYRTNDLAEFYPERMKSGQKGFRYKNAFGKPNFRRYYYELSQGNFALLYDATAVGIPTGINLWLDFVSQPADPYLNPDKTVDYNLLVNNSLLLFNTGVSRNYVYYEIVNVCKEIFLENIESMRTQEAIRQTMIQ